MDNLVIFKKGDNVVLKEAYRGNLSEVFEVIYIVPDLHYNERVGELGSSNQYSIRDILSPGRDLLYYQYQLQPYSEVKEEFITWYENRVKKLKKLD